MLITLHIVLFDLLQPFGGYHIMDIVVVVFNVKQMICLGLCDMKAPENLLVSLQVTSLILWAVVFNAQVCYLCGFFQPESSALFSDPPFMFSSDPSAVPLSDSSSMAKRVSAEEHSELMLLCSTHSAHASGDGSAPS